MVNILQYRGKIPKIGKNVFLAENATIIGDVEIGDNSSVWYNCVIRGDVNYIKIGSNTNIQDGSIVHVHRKSAPTIIGDNVTIGHMAMIHGCTLHNYSFVGMGAKVLDYTVIEKFGMLGAGALLTQNKRIESNQLWVGAPAKYLRPLTQEEIDWIGISAENYVKLGYEYLGIHFNI
jgi:carbonic anhydrase/acetyltransferase-like protein (isoleucine patch superfamily)